MKEDLEDMIENFVSIKTTSFLENYRNETIKVKISDISFF